MTCIKPYFYAQTSDDAIALQGIRYLSVCCIFSPVSYTHLMRRSNRAASWASTSSISARACSSASMGVTSFMSGLGTIPSKYTITGMKKQQRAPAFRVENISNHTGVKRQK